MKFAILYDEHRLQPKSPEEKSPIIYVNFTQNYTYLLILSLVIMLYQHKNIDYLHKV